MTNEDAIMRLEALRAFSSENSLKTIGEAIDMAISALHSDERCDQNATGMRLGCKPLSLEQLRKMDGQPVWVHVIDHTVFADKEDDFDGWGMCRKSWVRIWDSKRADIVHIDYDFEDYGKDWVAYAYPPAHIDREGWEPCEFCGKADFGEYGFEIGRSYVKIACALGSWRFPAEEQFHFCPKCGRPLTEEAWAELEKRMGV